MVSSWYCSGICLEGLRKITEILSEDRWCSSDIQTAYFTDMNIECYCYTSTIYTMVQLM
jgi:hypothetical protein